MPNRITVDECHERLLAAHRIRLTRNSTMARKIAIALAHKFTTAELHALRLMFREPVIRRIVERALSIHEEPD